MDISKENKIKTEDMIKNKRKLRGVKRKEKYVYPEDKKGKAFHLAKFNDVNIEIYVPDVEKFKTVQISCTCWMELCGECTNEDVHKVTAIQKHRIKNLIRDLKIPMFEKESIVHFKSSDSKRQKSVIQYLLIELVLFVKPQMIYDKRSILSIVEPLVHNIIENYIPNDTYEVTRNAKVEARTDKVRKQKLNVR